MANFPLSSFHFQVEWSGTSMNFQEISGLSFEVDVIEYRGGASLDYITQKVPGMIKKSDITLKRGVVQGDNEFFEWFNTIQLSTVERRDITLSLLNEQHEPVVVYRVLNAWPSKIDASSWDAVKSTFAVETLVIQHEGLRLEHV